jgi:hypothetical protein
MHRVAAVLARDRDQPRAVQIGGGPRDTQRDRCVGRADMGRVDVVFRMDSDAGDGQFTQRAHDPQRDFAAICDENFVEQRLGHDGGIYREETVRADLSACAAAPCRNRSQATRR